MILENLFGKRLPSLPHSLISHGLAICALRVFSSQLPVQEFLRPSISKTKFYQLQNYTSQGFNHRLFIVHIWDSTGDGHGKNLDHKFRNHDCLGKLFDHRIITTSQPIKTKLKGLELHGSISQYGSKETNANA